MANVEPSASTVDTQTLAPQLTQARVPLDQAGEALLVRDATGRIPIVVVPKRSGRINVWLLLLGVAAVVAGIAAANQTGNRVWLPFGAVAGLILLVLSVFQAFRVMVPEGTNALLLRGGKYYKTLPSGYHFVPPYYPVSHLVTRRAIPFDVPGYVSPTANNVPATVDLLVMFTIVDPYKFVYSISPDDFDQVFLASCQDALRQLLRDMGWQDVPNLKQESTRALHQAIEADVADYGVKLNRVNITYASPPVEFMKSQELQALWGVQKAEVDERKALEVRRVEQEAAAESLRLQHLQERLEQFPEATRWEWEGTKLEVARALAGNTRAFVQVGESADIARAFVASELMSDKRAAEPV